MARKAATTEKANPYAALEQTLGHRFRQRDLLTLALTHRSFAFDGKTAEGADPSKDNEQLEFLGDAVLGMLAAEALWRRFPALREGDLTQLRASVVSRRHLGQVGTRLGLGQWLRLGQTAEKNNGRTNTALFANAVEAVLAAIYLDADLETARVFVDRHVLADLQPEAETHLARTTGDYKSALQEMLQATGQPRPEYRLIEATGPDHKRSFRVEVWLADAKSPLGQAEGTSKKLAQQEAARLSLVMLAAEAKPA